MPYALSLPSHPLWLAGYQHAMINEAQRYYVTRLTVETVGETSFSDLKYQIN
jgi:hypothetical protein